MNFICIAAVRSRFYPLAGIGLLALATVGCGTGDVSGKVTYKDKPVPFGTVLFEASDGTIKQGNIGTDGGYSIRGVTTGTARVAVNSPNPNSAEMTPVVKKGGIPTPRPDVPGWFPIPEKYSTPDKSELSYPVKSGSNEINIELK